MNGPIRKVIDVNFCHRSFSCRVYKDHMQCFIIAIFPQKLNAKLIMWPILTPSGARKGAGLHPKIFLSILFSNKIYSKISRKRLNIFLLNQVFLTEALNFLSFSSKFIEKNNRPFFIFQGQIKDAMGISTYQFANLYAWYSWPNVVLPIVGGYMMDTVFGIRLGTIIFALFIIIGELSPKSF